MPVDAVVIERQGNAVRLAGLPGWYGAGDLGPCRSCGGLVFDLVRRPVRTPAGTVIRESLRCRQCVPANPRRSEVAVTSVQFRPL